MLDLSRYYKLVDTDYRQRIIERFIPGDLEANFNFVNNLFLLHSSQDNAENMLYSANEATALEGILHARSALTLVFLLNEMPLPYSLDEKRNHAFGRLKEVLEYGIDNTCCLDILETTVKMCSKGIKVRNNNPSKPRKKSGKRSTNSEE